MEASCSGWPSTFAGAPADIYLVDEPSGDVLALLAFPCNVCVLQVRNLSGGELQRVAITLALGTPADIYLIDEPSAYLDSEQRIIAAKVGMADTNPKPRALSCSAWSSYQASLGRLHACAAGAVCRAR